MGRLYLTRHGQTRFNLLKKIQGSCDSPLTDFGKKQVLYTKKYFESNDIHFTHAYSSTQERASDSLELLVNLEYQRLKGLKEWDFGLFESESELLNPKPPYGDFFKDYGGESQREVGERMKKTLTEIMERQGHDEVLVLSHGGAIFSFISCILDQDQIKDIAPIGNCGIAIFEYNGGLFHLIDIINHDFSDIMGE